MPQQKKHDKKKADSETQLRNQYVKSFFTFFTIKTLTIFRLFVHLNDRTCLFKGYFSYKLKFLLDLQRNKCCKMNI